uniref:Uncharacterized protein n=1 Tax=Arundo donax TaxID=35708 RepID=A0A0A9BLN2_ARUDO
MQKPLLLSTFIERRYTQMTQLESETNIGEHEAFNKLFQDSQQKKIS